MNAAIMDIVPNRVEKKVKQKTFFVSQKDKYFELLLNIKRRNLNKREKLDPVLRFLATDYLVYDNVVFVEQNSTTKEKLLEVGFVDENRCRFDLSKHTMFWEEFMLEFEIVPTEHWQTLKKCATLSNLTSYYNLNEICATLMQD